MFILLYPLAARVPHGGRHAFVLYLCFFLYGVFPFNLSSSYSHIMSFLSCMSFLTVCVWKPTKCHLPIPKSRETLSQKAVCLQLCRLEFRCVHLSGLWAGCLGVLLQVADEWTKTCHLLDWLLAEDCPPLHPSCSQLINAPQKYKICPSEERSIYFPKAGTDWGGRRWISSTRDRRRQATDDCGVASYKHKSGEERAHTTFPSRDCDHYSCHAVPLHHLTC